MTARSKSDRRMSSQSPIRHTATGVPTKGTDIKESAMQAYLDWEYGLVEQLRRDATHGFFVI